MGKTYSHWTERELEVLRDMAGKFNATVIGERVGRGSDGVRKMIGKLGLQSYVNPATTERLAAPPKPAKAPVAIRAYVEEPSVALRKPLEAKSRKQPSSYPPMEICPIHKCWVSNWAEHAARLGCTKPAA